MVSLTLTPEVHFVSERHLMLRRRVRGLNGESGYERWETRRVGKEVKKKIHAKSDLAQDNIKKGDLNGMP